MINVYFLEHRRNFFPALEFFTNKIKPENKKLLKFYFLMTNNINFSFNTGIDYEIIYDFKIPNEIIVPNNWNLSEKTKFIMEQESEYCMLLAEDIIFNNYVWDYIIENREIVKQNDILTLSPIMNIAPYTVELFIDTFCPEKRPKIEKIFLQKEFSIKNNPNIIYFKNNFQYINKLFEKCNQCTIYATKWNYKKFLDILKECKLYIQLHPVMYNPVEPADIMMDVVLEDVKKFISPQVFSMIDFEKLQPFYGAFSSEIYLCDPKKLKETYYNKIKEKFPIMSSTEEIIVQLRNKQFGEKHILIKNSFAIHTYYRCSSPTLRKWKEQEIHDIILKKAKEYYNEI